MVGAACRGLICRPGCGLAGLLRDTGCGVVGCVLTVVHVGALYTYPMSRYTRAVTASSAGVAVRVSGAATAGLAATMQAVGSSNMACRRCGWAWLGWFVPLLDEAWQDGRRWGQGRTRGLVHCMIAIVLIQVLPRVVVHIAWIVGQCYRVLSMLRSNLNILLFPCAAAL